MSLSEMVLIKNNHIDARKNGLKGLQAEIDSIKPRYLPVQVEVRTIAELELVLQSLKPSSIMLDNMTNDQITTAVSIIKKHSSALPIEISGGITAARCAELVKTRADACRIGWYTHHPSSQCRYFDEIVYR